MRVLVCGGRNFDNLGLVTEVLGALHQSTPITAVISGKAPGADTLGEKWAHMNNVPVVPFPADWAKHGRAAGPIRNQQMLDEGKPDMVVAFPGGTGTRDMCRRAISARIRIVEVPVPNKQAKGDPELCR